MTGIPDTANGCPVLLAERAKNVAPRFTVEEWLMRTQVFSAMKRQENGEFPIVLRVCQSNTPFTDRIRILPALFAPILATRNELTGGFFNASQTLRIEAVFLLAERAKNVAPRFTVGGLVDALHFFCRGTAGER